MHIYDLWLPRFAKRKKSFLWPSVLLIWRKNSACNFRKIASLANQKMADVLKLICTKVILMVSKNVFFYTYLFYIIQLTSLLFFKLIDSEQTSIGFVWQKNGRFQNSINWTFSFTLIVAIDLWYINWFQFIMSSRMFCPFLQRFGSFLSFKQYFELDIKWSSSLKSFFLQ